MVVGALVHSRQTLSWNNIGSGSLLESRYQLQCVLDSAFIFVLGGQNTTTTTNSVEWTLVIIFFFILEFRNQHIILKRIFSFTKTNQSFFLKMENFYIHGSKNSNDIDIVYIAEKEPANKECLDFVKDKMEDVNIITLFNHQVKFCFKGLPDEVNNVIP